MTRVLLGLMGAGIAVWAARGLCVWHCRRRGTALSADPPAWPSAERPPRVTVIVPGKDEEANIAACLDSLLAQDYPNFDVIVVDDRSEDRTAEIAAGFAARDDRLRLIRNTALPDGWTGKCHALDAGAKQADGDWLLFTDADTAHAPTALRSAMTVAVSRGVDLFTLLPRVVTEGIWEGALQPSLAGVLLSLFPPSMVNRRRGLAFANGQYILVRRWAYDRLGGHAAVRGEFLEDIALARLAQEAALRVELADGGTVVRTRMYRGSRVVWRGWSRIFYGCGRPGLALTAWMLLSLLTTVLPAGVLVGALAALALGAPAAGVWPLLLVALVQVGLMFACMGFIYRLGRCRLRYLPLHPLATAFAVGVLANAVRLKWFARTITWRGTTYHSGTGSGGSSAGAVVTARAATVAAPDPPADEQDSAE